VYGVLYIVAQHQQQHFFESGGGEVVLVLMLMLDYFKTLTLNLKAVCIY
jgi:hypothetical protein